MGAASGGGKKGLGAFLARQQLKWELNAVLQRREKAVQRLGEGTFRLIEEGRLQPHPDSKDAYLDVRALDDRARQLKKMIAQGHVGPVPEPRRRPAASEEPEVETRPVSVDAGPVGSEEEAAAPAHVRAKLGACACGAVIPQGAKYCPRCGMPAEPEDIRKTIAPPRKCPQCGTEIPLGAEYCPECGAHADQEVYEV